MKLQRLFGAIAAAMLLVSQALATEQSSYVMPDAGPMAMSTLVDSHLNPGLRAIASCNWGASAPANGPSGAPLPYQCWADTTSNPTQFKYWDGAQWVVFGKLDTSAHSWMHIDTTNTTPEIWLAIGQSNFAVQRSLSWSPPANAHVWNNAIATCITTGNAWTAFDPTTVTPEDAFIADRALHFPNKQIYLIRVAYNNQAIAQWLPGAVDNCPTPATLQDMYTKAKNNVVPALANLGLSKLTGILFWQGETDGLNGSTTWRTDFETLVTRYKGETFYPAASSIPNWIVFGIAGRMQSSPLATADSFNQTYILPAVNNDPFNRIFVNTAMFPAAFWDTSVIPGHMNATGYYQVGTLVSRSLYTNTPDGFIFSSGGTTGGALNASPPAICSAFAFSCLNANTAATFPILAGTIAHWVGADGVTPIHMIDGYGTLGFSTIARLAGGALGAKTAVPDATIVAQYGAAAWNGSTYSGGTVGAAWHFFTEGLQAAGTNYGMGLRVSVTPNGSITQTDQFWFRGSGCFSVGVGADCGNGYIDALNGYKINNAAGSAGHGLRSNGSAYVDGQFGFGDLSGSASCAQMPALTGNITSAPGSCNTAIATAAVTYAMMQNVAASRLLGNPTGSPAAPSEIPLDSTLGFSGSSLKCTTGTTSQLGCLKPDGTTITVVGGIITASGGSATTVTPGTTTVGGGSVNAGYALTNSGGTLNNASLFSSAGGFINRFRNAAFDVWQRGTSAIPASTSGAYTADGWIVTQTGAAFTCAQDTGNNGTLFSLKCVGGTSNTDTTFAQRIDSAVAAPLAGKTVTVQFQYKQSSGGSVTPKISACYASATDNFTTCTSDLAATGVSACASGSWCTESYTFAVSANASNGYQITLDCNAALSAAQACWIAAADVRVTPGVTTGINANPPAPELRPISVELLLNRRRFESSYSNALPGTASAAGSILFYVGSNTIASGQYDGIVLYGVPKACSLPTVNVWGFGGTANVVSNGGAGVDLAANSGTVNTRNQSGFSILNSNGSSVTTTAGATIFHYTASCEL